MERCSANFHPLCLERVAALGRNRKAGGELEKWYGSREHACATGVPTAHVNSARDTQAVRTIRHEDGVIE
jgi:hypothetical protein